MSSTTGFTVRLPHSGAGVDEVSELRFPFGRGRVRVVISEGAATFMHPAFSLFSHAWGPLLLPRSPQLLDAALALESAWRRGRQRRLPGPMSRRPALASPVQRLGASAACHRIASPDIIANLGPWPRSWCGARGHDRSMSHSTGTWQKFPMASQRWQSHSKISTSFGGETR